MQQRPIEVDIDVYRFIEGKRTSFAQSHNDILRVIAGLTPAVSSNDKVGIDSSAGLAWTGKGVSLPHGTKLRMNYNGKTHHGEIFNGAWHIEGGIYRSPSAAAGGVARSKQGRPVSLDGWSYWETQTPHSTRWKPIAELRTKSNT
ncbi:hypothetical protein [Novosphingobium sp. FSW06-99]|uniref:hypothetical protein n=1 Tax=Novosphingobium sp. FSW06-99 TaxID=1739113 RepID=UPI0012E3D562|nr:hypothetical protein [Novosphingobium sp. FSW06-99]